MKNIPYTLPADNSIPDILEILKEGENTGFKILQKLKLISEEPITWKEGFIYPTLKKLEYNRLIKSRWDKTDLKRPRKYYRLYTPKKRFFLFRW